MPLRVRRRLICCDAIHLRFHLCSEIRAPYLMQAYLLIAVRQGFSKVCWLQAVTGGPFRISALSNNLLDMCSLRSICANLRSIHG
jgi:hypothetical protein